MGKIAARKFDGKTYTYVKCVDSKTRKNAVISHLKESGYLYRAIKEGTCRKPIWRIYKRMAAKIRRIQEYKIVEARTYPTVLVATTKTKKEALRIAQKRSVETSRTIVVNERATLGGYDDSCAVGAFNDGKRRHL